MNTAFNIYCDESCHLEKDHQAAMVLGAIWCPVEKTREIAVRLREKKQLHGLPPDFEVKWTKVSPAKLNFYRDVLDYFFDDDDLFFRAVIIPDKTKLKHAAFGQDHDTWYYKMYFLLLEVLLTPHDRYRIYLDKKDTCGAEKVRKLHDVLCNNMYDFDRRIIERVQLVTSHEVEQIQLCDVLTGAISYVNRGQTGSPAKASLVERMQARARYSLTKTTLLRERKMNLIRWEAKA
jgi:hypothetical protein